MERKRGREKFNILYSVLALAAMWLAWLIAALCVKNEYLVPSVGESVKEFFTLFGQAFFWRALGWTVLRTLSAFAISFILGLLCAVAGVVFAPFAAFLRPIISVCRTLPTMAVILLILIWSSPRTAPIVVTVLVLFPMIYAQLTQAIEGVDKGLLQMARVYEMPKGKVLSQIYIPQIAPAALQGAGTDISFGIKLTISAEVMASTYTAIGGLMSEAQIYYNLPRLAALTLCAVLLGIAVEALFRLIDMFTFKWREGERS